MPKLLRNFNALTAVKIHLSALALLTVATTTGLVLAVFLGVTAVAILAVVVWPAVWAKKSRRDAALAVLDRILRHR
jgi:hypothetical protein